MFGGLENLFTNFVDFAAQAAAASQATTTNTATQSKPPPASKKAIDSLAMVKVTADDLLEETNKECLICLVDQEVGKIACKLPCGHLFHKVCVTEWLEKQCTCPVCRYEIGTDDRVYEGQRREKMKQRKLRMRRDEIKAKSVSQLKELCQSLGIAITGCIDKEEIVECIANSGKVVITEGAPPIRVKQSEFLSKNVSELKQLLKSFGISTEGALEKSELRKRLEESGRVVVLPDDEVMEEEEERLKKPPASSSSSSKGGSSEEDSSYHVVDHDDAMMEEEMPPLDDYDIMDIDEDDQVRLPPGPAASSSSSKSEKKEDSSSPLPSPHSSSSFRSNNQSPPKPSTDSTIYIDDLKALSISALRDLCKRHQINTVGCLEKSEIVQRVMSSEKIQILYDISPPPIQVSEEKEEVFTEDQLRAMAISALKVICNSYGIQVDSNIVDKYMLVDQMLASRKLKIVAKHSLKNEGGDCKVSSFTSNSSNSNSSNSSSSASSSTVHQQSSVEPMVLSRELLHEMSIRELRSILEAFSINTMDCVDKYDLIELLENCQFVNVID